MARKTFVDYVKICCRTGKGGAGSTHLRREKFEPKGGPDGGDGGRGGHVIIKGNPQLWTLLHLKYTRHIIAGHGERGSKSNSTGASGKDAYIEVPLGTIVRDPETQEVLLEITDPNQEYILLEGGRGGLGNSNFKSSTHQTPRYAQPGEDGKEEWKILELKILADVGLVGFPNAGKSTFLASISAAKPEIGDYPFTTLVPNLGMVSYRGHKSFMVADIPGIIEDAHLGKGLGLRFLRHIERNSVLLFMVPADADSIVEQYEILKNELNQFNPELMHKKHLLAITKCDMLDEELMEEIKQEVPEGIQVSFISSVTGLGLQELKDKLWLSLSDNA